MGTAETTTAVTALIISLFALLTSIGQLLQQYFGAADGYRRCQAPIIGDWADFTRLHFRWREFRFEVTFEAPVIGIDYEESPQHGGGARLGVTRTESRITGTAESRKQTLSPSERPNEAQVGWLSFIDRLHILQSVDRQCRISGARVMSQPETDPTWSGVATSSCHPRMPSISSRPHSWDFMPTDFLRPVASSTVGEMIILAHRLGMGWRQLRPGLGEMYAEGNGQTLTGSMLRGFGVVLHYTRDLGFEARNAEHMNMNLVIPTEEADKMGFGIIPGDTRLELPDLAMTAEDGRCDEIDASMIALNISSRAQYDIRNRWKQREVQNGWHEVICLSCPFLPQPTISSINCALRPLPQIASPLLWREGRQAFRTRLRFEVDMLRSSNKSPRLAKHLEYLYEQYTEGSRHKMWESQHFLDKSARNRYDKNFLLFLKAQHDWTTKYFLGEMSDTLKSEQGQDLSFKDLLAAHISMTPEAIYKQKENLKNGTKRDLGGARIPGGLVTFMFEQFQVYVDQLPEVARTVRESCGIDDEELLKEAWWTLMWRGIVWWMSVQILGGPHRTPDDRRGIYVPSVYWGSKVPVYIA